VNDEDMEVICNWHSGEINSLSFIKFVHKVDVHWEEGKGGGGYD